MRNINIMVVVLVTVLLPGSSTACTAGDPQLNSSLEKKIQKLMRKQHLPGFAITIVQDQEVLYQEAFGLADREHSIPATTGTVFRFLSVSKMFTALELFREVEEGLVTLDDPLTKYLPDFTIQSRTEKVQPITVKEILAHRSGLPRNGWVYPPGSETGSTWLDKFESSAAGCFLAFPEGTRYHYSNLGYNLLGRIIEETRNEPFVPYMKEHLFSELGMEHTAFHSAGLGSSPVVASGYEYYKRKYYPMIRSDINGIPSGNLYSTIEDMSIFLTSVFAQTIFASSGTMARMFEDHFSRPEDPETMGLGWKTTKLRGSELVVWHDGGPDDGSGALVALMPSRKLGISLIGNCTTLSGAVSLPFAMDIFDQLLGTQKGTAPDHPSEPETLRNPDQSLAEYEGTYAAFGQIMKVKAKNRSLKGKINGLGLEMIPDHDSTFRVTHWLEKLGLTKIINLPIDFDKIHVTFCNKDFPGGGAMIINLDNIAYEFCPGYPDHLISQCGWEKLAGDYRMAERLPDNKPGAFTGSVFSITPIGHTLVMSGVFGPILPIGDHYLEILSGPFAGETMEYDPATGILVHQNAVFVPA
jgi:CubicO group peptidase (beta-lactamase class C family)